ncbi:MAG: formate/nitrite transporter family protein [Oscillospiraceae bacterium]
MLEDIRKSVLAGILIATGGCVYLACASAGIGWIGSLLFAVGLYTICMYGFNLYTGKVGYIADNFKDVKYIGRVALILAFNLLTTFAVGVLVRFSLPEIAAKAADAYAAKLAAEPVKWAVSSVFCGMLMFIAVDTWKRGSKLGVFLCVPTFILSGFDHSIANSFYNGAALSENTFTLRNVLFVAVVVLGNAAGGMLIPLLKGKDKTA